MGFLDWITDHLGWVISVAAAVSGYLLRSKSKDGGKPIHERWDTSWIGRRLAVERELLRCKQELVSEKESFTRQLEGRDQEIAYLMAKLARLMSEAEKVVSRASVQASGHWLDEPTDLPPTSPPLPLPLPKSRAKTSKPQMDH